NCLVYQKGDKVAYGFLQDIFVCSIPGNGEKALAVVKPVRNLFPKDTVAKSKRFQYWLYLMKSVVGKIEVDGWEVVAMDCVRGVCAYRELQSGAFGIMQDGVALTPVDHLAYLPINEAP
ncbi:hypothetical protein CROQUDRAFT_16662, partial [Cronartium quercuum f. sp. fusiforme G11]